VDPKPKRPKEANPQRRLDREPKREYAKRLVANREDGFRTPLDPLPDSEPSGVKLYKKLNDINDQHSVPHGNKYIH
jgi:hypothetical protein